ncbi:MAG: folate-binding protein [Pseudomonadota bacterium]
MTMRTIYRMTGADARTFLQGLVTNDVNGLDHGLVYTALLTPQGKFIADFFLVPEEDTLLVDVDAELADTLMQRLALYKLRSDVQIAVTDLAVRRGTGPVPEGAFADPRHPDLGWRLYGTEDGDDGSTFDAIRVAHCIPEPGTELGPDSYILEAGFERLNGVDFRKGCYVGQEVTARMKHKANLRKGFVTVEVEGEAMPGTEIMADGKQVGMLHTRHGDRAIAYLRLDRLQPDLHAGQSVIRYVPDIGT